MFSPFVRGLLVAAAFSAASVAAHAATSPYVFEQSSPSYWGQNGSFAIMEIWYDPSAKVPLTISQPNIVDLAGQGTSLLNLDCGTPVKQGDTVVAYTLAPGQVCYYQIGRTGDSVAATVVLNDTTGKAANIQTFVRGSLEIYDGNANVLTHAEMR